MPHCQYIKSSKFVARRPDESSKALNYFEENSALSHDYDMRWNY